jgi:TonB dependent receptor/TonB-dependent Receptor Plug Domain/CarboxypepD_reg-like domain
MAIKNIKFLIVLFLIILIGNNISAQKSFKLSGVVLDSLAGTKLANASVNINFGEKIFLTDEAAKFSVYVRQGEVTLNIKYVGYFPFRIRLYVNKDMDLEVYMKELAKDLEQVIVNAKSQNEYKRPVMGVSTLNIKSLQKIPTVLGEVDVLRGIQLLPGVSSVGEASNGVNIRGGTTDQNLLLLDDAPIFNPTHMFGLFSAFPSDAVSGFDLYKGNVPSRYSGRAAAVLDVSLAQPSLEKTSMKVGLGIVSSRLLADLPIIKGKMGIMIAGRIAANDWLLPIISNELNDIKAKFGDATAKLFYKINSKNTLSISSYYSADFIQTKILGSINNINSTNTQYDYRTKNISAKWFRQLSEKLNIQTILVQSKYTPITLLPELNSKNKVKIFQNIDYQQVKSNINYNIRNHIIEIGVDATKYIINPGELLPGTNQFTNSIKTPIENGLELGGFAEDEFQLSKRLTISAGLRYSNYRTMGKGTYNIYSPDAEKNEESSISTISFEKNQIVKSYAGFEPRIGASFVLNNESSIKVGYTKMRQYLQVISNTTTPIPTSRWKSSDLNIKPQISELYSIGYFKNINDNIYEISAETYFRNTQNVIDYKPGASFLLKSNIETELLQGKNNAYGLEMMLSKKKGELTGWVNYTYARSFNKINEGPNFKQQINYGNWYSTNYDRPHTFNASIVVAQTKMHDFSFNFTYSTGRPFTAPSGFIKSNFINYPIYNLRNNDRIPSYNRLDFAWNIYDPLNKNRRFKGNWNFTIYNLYGRKNAYSIYMKNENLVTNPFKLYIFGAAIPSLSYNFTLK